MTLSAAKVLARLRNLPADHEIVVKEAQEILDALELESKEEGSWGDLFKSGGITANKRFYLALGIQFMQQLTGRHSLSVFHCAPLTRVSARYQHRDVLRANALRVESAHVARNGALPRLLAASLVYHCVIRHSRFFMSNVTSPWLIGDDSGTPLTESDGATYGSRSPLVK